MDRKTIKQLGKENVKKQWGELLLAIVLSAAAGAVAALFTGGIGAFVVTGPLAYGTTYLYYRSTQGEKVGQMMLLQGFKDKFGESFLVGLLIQVIQMIPLLVGVFAVMSALAAMIGAVMSMGMNSYGMYGSGYGSGVGAGAAAGFGGFFMFLLFVALCIAFVFIYLGIFMAVYILMREKDATAVEALKKSWAMMKGQKGRVFVFWLSFIGWFLLCGITMGILLIWVMPYYRSSEIILMNDIYESSNIADDAEFSFKNEWSDIKSGFGDMNQKVGGAKAEDSAAETQAAGAGQVEVQTEQTEQTAAGEAAPMQEEQAAPDDAGAVSEVPAEAPAEETAEVKVQQPEEPAQPQVRRCSTCGAVVREGAKFCNSCGNPL